MNGARTTESAGASARSRGLFSVEYLAVGELSSLAFALGAPLEISLWGWFPVFRMGRRVSYALARRCRIALDDTIVWQFDAIIVTGTLKQIVLWPVSALEVRLAEKIIGRPNLNKWRNTLEKKE